MFDLHAHFIPPDVMGWLRRHADAVDARWERRQEGRSDFLVVGGRWPFELKPAFVEPQLFLQEQARAGVTCTLVSPVPQLFVYEAPAAAAAELAALYNDTLASWAREAGGAVLALATVPLQEPVRAAQELERAMGMGLRGAIVGTDCAGRMLSDPSLLPFWEAADGLGAVVFVHPLLSQDPRLRRPMMPHLVGVPWETTVAAADLILSGLLDRFARVRLLLAHGGGYLPYQLGRMERGYHQWPAVRAALTRPPSEYLRRFWFDSLLWSRQALDCLVALAGPDRVVPGSDYPFDLSARPPAPVGEAGVRALLGLPDSPP